MNKQEFSMFVMALKTYYPKENLLPNSEAIELWYRQLSDIPFRIAEASLNKWVATNKWSPAISEIREMASSVKFGEAPDWSEGWQQVQKAIRHYGMYRSDEALESMDDVTRESVKRMGFTNICASENPMSERARFAEIYKSISERRKKESQIPPQLMQVLLEIRQDQLKIESK